MHKLDINFCFICIILLARRTWYCLFVNYYPSSWITNITFNIVWLVRKFIIIKFFQYLKKSITRRYAPPHIVRSQPDRASGSRFWDRISHVWLWMWISHASGSGFHVYGSGFYASGNEIHSFLSEFYWLQWISHVRLSIPRVRQWISRFWVWSSRV